MYLAMVFEAMRLILSEVAFTIRSTYHTTLEATPGQLVFGQDMILPVPFTPNWDQIKQRKQALIDKNTQHENNR